MTPEQIDALGVSTDIVTAAAAFGIGTSTAYAAADRVTSCRPRTSRPHSASAARPKAVRADHFAAIEDLGLIADDHTEDLRTPRMEMPPTQSLGGQVEGDTNNHEGSQS